ncbi:MAG: alkaline phosphatase [Planctomycetota bacterium]|nr:alkaline phosphatase [Planctomycetota bacterium]
MRRPLTADVSAHCRSHMGHCCQLAALITLVAFRLVALAEDPIRGMQIEAEIDGVAAWGHWGDQPERYVSWSNHSNRLIPVYTFGVGLTDVGGANSPYRSEERLRSLYGRLPEETVDPRADYFDQTDVYRLQMMAADKGKRRIVLFVFDGLDWETTRAAAIASSGAVTYDEGRGDVFGFQTYRGVATDFGWCVTSPANDGTRFDVDAQAVRNPGGKTPGGYDSQLGGGTPWDRRANARYLMGRDRDRPHAVTDSAASATSLCSGRKTYNDAINVDPAGEPVEPIAVTLQNRGYAVGVVTSVPISHATPACAYANNVTRDDYQDLSRDLLGQPSVARRTALRPGLDVLLGAGFGVQAEADAQQGQNYESGNKYLAPSTLRAVDATHGGRYHVVQRTAGRHGDELLAEAAAAAIAAGRPLFGFFGVAEGHLPFQTACGDFNPIGSRVEVNEPEPLRKKYAAIRPYTPADIDENPTLADMTRAALDVLAARGSFWLMVEAGDVDWASHANNIDTAIGAVKSGDAAFWAVVKWVEQHGGWKDTAVIVTADHGHMFVLDDAEVFASRSRGAPTAVK